MTLQLRATAGAVGAQVNQATVTVPVSTNLSVGMTNGVTTLPAGSTTSYTVMVTNGGRLLGGQQCADGPTSGGAVCPGLPVSLSALPGGGLTLPAGSNLTFALTCGVTATGL